MGRPTNKAGLIAAAEEQWGKLWALIDGMGAAGRAAAFAFDTSEDKEAHWRRDKNLRDVLVHLYEWHQLLIRWVEANMGGGDAPFLPPPYNWKSYGEMNVMFWERHQDTLLEDAMDMVRGSHGAVLALIEGLDGEGLFEKGRYGWVGGSTLGSYCVSVTSSHYDWAVKKLKRQVKALG